MRKLYLVASLALLLCSLLCAGLLPAALADGEGYELQTPSLGTCDFYRDGVLFTWNKPLNSLRYGVFRKTGDGPWRGLAVVTSLSYKDTDVEPGVTYSYTVCCVSPDGKSMLSDFNKKGLSVTIPSGLYDPVQLQTPVLLDAQNVTNGIKLSWQPVSGAAKYGIFRRTGSEAWRGLAVSLAPEYTDESVNPGVTYSYTVCCLSPDGQTLQSAYDQNGISVTVSKNPYAAAQLPAPVLQYVQNVSGGVRLSWQAVSGAAKYGVFRRTGNEAWRGLAIVTETSFTDTGTVPGVSYSYTVCCVSDDGKSLTSPFDDTGRSIRADPVTDSGSMFAIQPKDTGAKQMTYASFQAKAASAGAQYSWEMRAKDGTEWYKLPEIAWLIGGVNSNTLIIGAVLGLDGYHFRCLVTDGQRSEYSNTVSLHVVP